MAKAKKKATRTRKSTKKPLSKRIETKYRIELSPLENQRFTEIERLKEDLQKQINKLNNEIISLCKQVASSRNVPGLFLTSNKYEYYENGGGLILIETPDLPRFIELAVGENEKAKFVWPTQTAKEVLSAENDRKDWLKDLEKEGILAIEVVGGSYIPVGKATHAQIREALEEKRKSRDQDVNTISISSVVAAEKAKEAIPETKNDLI